MGACAYQRNGDELDSGQGSRVTFAARDAASRRWDLVVIGGGTAGIVGSRTAASFGARVALVEGARTGGDCLWTGCVPSKALLAAARRAATARTASRLGVHVDGVRVDFAAVRAHVRAAIAAIEPDDSPETLQAAGVAVVKGWARLTPEADVEVDGHVLRTRQVLLATGSTPEVPDVSGLRATGPWTTETIWALERLPNRLTIVGGGNTGCELGQAFARLGARVSLVERESRLLAGEDPEAAGIVAAALRAEGVEIHLGSGLAGVTGSADAGEVQLATGRRIEHDGLLVALGRRPATGDLGLREAGVRLDDRDFVITDPRLRTTNPRVWAAGDLTGHPQFTHVAGVHGSIAATNAVLGLRRTVDTTSVPRVTYTDPEIAAVGAATGPYGRDGDLDMVTVRHDDVDRAVADAETTGYTRLAIDRRHRIVGATVVGPRAGETLPELVLAVREGWPSRHLAEVTHAYPTYADGVWNAAIADVRTRLSAPAAARAITVLAGARRRWLDRSWGE